MSYKSDNGMPMKFTDQCQTPSNTGSCTNSGFNYGISSKLGYDQSCIKDSIEQSVAPLQSVLDPNRVRNCKQCLNPNGSAPRSSFMGWGDSLPIENAGIAPAQQLSDIDSIMTNRNVKESKDKKGKLNPVNLNEFKLYDSAMCNNFLDPLNSTLTFPKQLYREMSINRFYSLNNNPQKNIYWDGAVNSRLEASDNYDMPYPYSISGDLDLPNATKTVPSVQPNQYKQNGVPVLMKNETINNVQQPYAVTNNFNLYNPSNNSNNSSGNSTDNESM